MEQFPWKGSLELIPASLEAGTGKEWGQTAASLYIIFSAMGSTPL